MNTLFQKNQDGKWVEFYQTELPEFEAGRLRIHKSWKSCRFLGCEHADWYFSERVLAFHQRKEQSEISWSMPSSCPNHRNLSKQKVLATLNPDQCPVSGKRAFRDEADARAFAATQTPAQYIYPCSDCGSWHLTSMSPEQVAELEERKQQRLRENAPVPVAAAASAAAPTTQPQDREKIACERYQKGDQVIDIAADMKVHHLTIYKWLRKHGATKSAQKALTASSPFKAPVDLDAEEARLMAALEETRRKKKLMEDAKLLRVELVGTTAFIITKEGERATLPLTELEPLIDKLMTLAPQQSAQLQEAL